MDSPVTIVVLFLSFITFLYGIGALGSHTYRVSEQGIVTYAQCLPIGPSLFKSSLSINIQNHIAKFNGITKKSYVLNEPVDVYHNKNELDTISLSQNAPTTTGSTFFILLSFILLAIPYIIKAYMHK
jgi:hypothetical protein